MTAIGPFAIPILAAGTFAATLGWFGYQYATRPAPAPKAEPAVVESTPNPDPAPGQSSKGQEAGSPVQPARVNGANGGTAAPAEAAPTPPAFDVVRVEPTGDTVVAGRAAPGASVELVLNGVRQSRVVADPSGLFALVPEPLPVGSHELSLQVTNGDGTRIRSQQSVTVVVAANRKDPPLVTITTPGQPAVVLSRPDGGTVATAEPARPAAGEPARNPPAGESSKPNGDNPAAAKGRRSVQIASVETEGAGRLLVSGSAAPAAVVRLYLNDTFIAPASAGADGRVSFAIERGMQPGTYKVRLDDIDPVSGQVRSRAEVPFEMPQQVASGSSAGPASSKGQGGETAPEGSPTRMASVGDTHAGGAARNLPAHPAEPTVVVPEINTAIVSRGESLWAISKRAYGEGLRYSVIYGANAKQIRDPNLIYPGQLFVLPPNEAAKASP